MRKIVGFLAIIAVAGVVACTSEEAADETVDQPQMEETDTMPADTMPADTVMARDTAGMEEEM